MMEVRLGKIPGKLKGGGVVQDIQILRETLRKSSVIRCCVEAVLTVEADPSLVSLHREFIESALQEQYR